jgi:radical SAM protein with 4Fe4S-binding SPASM domain
MSLETMDRLVGALAEAGVFHVILSGGEPFENFDVLVHGFHLLRQRKISFSCNSNLILATPERIRRLADVGLDHILTSLNSYRADVNDAMVNGRRALEKTKNGIRLARLHGIRVSANMIVSETNRSHVYETGRLAAELGCQKLFATRTVPPERADGGRPAMADGEKETTVAMLEQLLRVKQDFGITIGTLVSYPLCLLGDLELFRDLVGRGCPAQSGHAMNISATGECTPCVHQSVSHGNVFREGIRAAYARMRPWHAGAYTHAACAGCPYVETCRSGCRSSAKAYFGALTGPDPLMAGVRRFTRHYHLVQDPEIEKRIRSGARLHVPDRLRFRPEKGFYLINIRWANTIACPNDLAEHIVSRQGKGFFTGGDIGWEHAGTLAQLYWKDALESSDLPPAGTRGQLGLSSNIAVTPE